MSGNGNGNGNGGGGHHHVKLVQPITPAEQQQKNCVLKFRELLAQAEQGQFISMCVVVIRPNGTQNFHWVGSEVTILGTLQILRRLLTDRLAKTMRNE